jgi:integrase
MSLKKNDLVEGWLARFSPSTATTYRFHFERWIAWMRKNGGKLADLSPDELVEHQRNVLNSDRYVILDLLQRHVREIPGRYNYKMKPYTTIRSFFKHNRAELPSDTFAPRAEVPPVRGTLTVEEVKLVALSSKPVFQAIYLCMLQGGMGEAELIFWSNAGYKDLAKALPEVMSLRRDDRILKIDLPGRKKNRNVTPFHTYIGADALEAVENWLKRRPEGAGAIFTSQYSKPLNEENVRTYWSRKLVRLGLIEPGEPGSKSNRYGKNLHEVRDVFRSLWEKSPAKGSVAEFMMGHEIDPLEYNKACKDEAWTLGQYKKALPMLQIISSGTPFGQVELSELDALRSRIKELEAGKNDRVAELEERLERLARLVEAMSKDRND